MKRLICFIRGHRWCPWASHYGELNCDHCGHLQSAYTKDPFTLAGWLDGLRHRLRWDWHRFGGVRYRIRRLFMSKRRRQEEDDVPF